MQMPPMTIDEELLLLDTYFKVIKTTDETLKHLFIEDLSDTLRNLNFFPKYRGNETLRNTTGMSLMLMNIDYVVKGKWSKDKISKTKQEILDRYQEDKTLLHNVSQAIKHIATLQNCPDFYSEINSKFLGGNLLLNYHKFIETKSTLAKGIINDSLIDNECRCSVCLHNLTATFGKNAVSLIELHFCAPINWYTAQATPMTNQFKLFCPTCHKLAHSDVIMLSKVQLERSINPRTQNDV